MHIHSTQPAACNVNKLKFQSITFLIYKYSYFMWNMGNIEWADKGSMWSVDIQMKTDIWIDCDGCFYDL